MYQHNIIPIYSMCCVIANYDTLSIKFIAKLAKVYVQEHKWGDKNK